MTRYNQQVAWRARQRRNLQRLRDLQGNAVPPSPPGGTRSPAYQNPQGYPGMAPQNPLQGIGQGIGQASRYAARAMGGVPQAASTLYGALGAQGAAAPLGSMDDYAEGGSRYPFRPGEAQPQPLAFPPSTPMGEPLGAQVARLESGENLTPEDEALIQGNMRWGSAEEMRNDPGAMDTVARESGFRDADQMSRQYGMGPERRPGTPSTAAPVPYAQRQRMHQPDLSGKAGTAINEAINQRRAEEDAALTAQGYGRVDDEVPQGEPGSPERLAWAKKRAANRAKKRAPLTPEDRDRYSKALAQHRANERERTRPHYASRKDRQAKVQANAEGRAAQRRGRLASRRSGISPSTARAYGLVERIIASEQGGQPEAPPAPPTPPEPPTRTRKPQYGPLISHFPYPPR